MKDVDGGFLRGLVVSSVAIATLWWTPLLFPFRLLVTTVHELSHAILALLTGGIVRSFDVNWDGSGVVMSAGGSAVLVFSAGYLGSTLFGGTMLLVAKNARGRRRALRFVGIATVGVLAVAGVLSALRSGSVLALVVFKDLWAFGIVCLLVGALELVVRRAHDVIVGFISYTIAELSVLYAVFDLLNLLTSTVHPLGGYNDARGLAEATHIPAVIWALAWCAAAIWIVWRFLRRALRAEVPALPGGGVAR